MEIKDIENILNFRYDETHLEWEYPPDVNTNLLLKYPNIFKYFDSIIMNNKIIGNYSLDFNSNKNKNILCFPSSIEHLINIIKPETKKNILIIAGEDLKLSQTIELIKKIIFNFNEIYYEAKDINFKNIKAIPMGLDFAYVLRNGGNNVILDVINRNNLPKKN